MEDVKVAADAFWQGKRVLVTGSTGFKGAWLCLWLCELGAKVTGLALPPATEPSLFDLLNLRGRLAQVFGDLRDPHVVKRAVSRAAPEIVFHLASQALVREGFRDPAGTFITNVAGLVNLFEALRDCAPLAIVNVTSDKVYRNDGDGRAFAEGDALGGGDPYSASKASAELVSGAYRNSTFAHTGIRLATARAGNVIGGGDWSADRIVPDIVRAIVRDQDVVLRYPSATRPWQHVLDPLAGYLMLAESLAGSNGGAFEGAWNFGPPIAAAAQPPTVAQLAQTFLRSFGSSRTWRHDTRPNVPEAALLCIDSTAARSRLGWRSRLSTGEAIDWTARWYAAWRCGRNVCETSLAQIAAHEKLLDPCPGDAS